LQPDVTVMDINLPGIGGIEVVRRIVSRVPEAKIPCSARMRQFSHPYCSRRARLRHQVGRARCAD
jgi:CheY-like chemotaxis protein